MGKKSKFAEKSADFVGFSREKNQNLQKNRPISREKSQNLQTNRPISWIVSEKIKISKENSTNFTGNFGGKTSPRNNQ